jgi:hypothetical protein
MTAIGIQNGQASRLNGSNTALLPLVVHTGEASSTAPSDYADLITMNVEAGVWTLEEGLITVLSLLAGEITKAEVSGISRLRSGEGFGVSRMAVDYLQSGDNVSAKTEIERLLNAIVPPQDNLDLYSVPADALQTEETRAIPNNEMCVTLWHDGLPVDKAIPCFEYRESTFSLSGGTTVSARVYYPLWWADNATLQPFFDLTLVAVGKSMLAYDLYGDIPNAAFIFGPTLDPDTPLSSLMTTYKVPKEYLNYNACVVAVYEIAQNLTMQQFAQSIAHEMFHCYVSENFFEKYEPGYDVIDWWAEGTAEYFSNVVYPTTDFEHRWLNGFNKKSANLSLVFMKYETYLFFQYLGNKVGNEEIIILLDSMPSTAGTLEKQQADALAEQPGIEARFHQFGRDFLDGAIIDSRGSKVQSDALPLIYSQTTENALDFSMTGDTNARSVSVFTLKRYPMMYEEQLHFTQTVEVEHATHAVAQVTDGLVFNADITTGEADWVPLSEQIVSGCAEPNHYVLLLTSTKVDQHDALHLQIQIDEAVERPCVCYFDVKFGGALSAFYTSPGYYDIVAQPFQYLRILGIGDSFLTDAGTRDYPAEATGEFPLDGFSFVDNAAGVVVVADENVAGDIITITESNDQFVAGQIRATLLDGTSNGQGGAVTLNAQFKAARTISATAQACDEAWDD